MRIRTIKPEFWTNEKLSELPEVVHMFAAALLNYADDEGYFNANPGLIKAALYPLREPSVSVQAMLSRLSSIDYLRLGGASDGRTYGWIVHFNNHQTINRPTASKIRGLAEFPAPLNEPSGETHAPLIEPSVSTPTRNREQGTGNREGNLETLSSSGDDAPLSASGLPADDGDREPRGGRAAASEADPEPGADGLALGPEPGVLPLPGVARFGPDELGRLWNALAPPECPRIREVSEKRRKAAAARLREHPREDFWRGVLERMADFPFLRGGGPREWKAGFDWLVRPDSATNVLEGTYGGEPGRSRKRDPRVGSFRAEDAPAEAFSGRGNITSEF